MKTIIISALTVVALLSGGAAKEARETEAFAANSEQRSPRDSIRMYEIEPQPAVTILARFDRSNRTEALDFVFNGEELDLPLAGKSPDSETEPAPAENEQSETPE